MKKHSIMLCCIAALLLSFSMAHADRTIWYVHPDSALNTIQAGIDSCLPGDIVLVGPGTYIENINFNGKAITVTSELGPNFTTIDGGNPAHPDTGSVVLFVSGEDTNSVLHGFTITNGSGTTMPPYGPQGGGIWCHDTSSPTISGNIITGNTATYGGGIELYINCSPIIIVSLILPTGIIIA